MIKNTITQYTDKVIKTLSQKLPQPNLYQAKCNKFSHWKSTAIELFTHVHMYYIFLDFMNKLLKNIVVQFQKIPLVLKYNKN